MFRENGRQIDAVLFDLYGTLVDIEIDTGSASTWTQFSRELAARGINIASRELRDRYSQLVKAEEHEHGEPFVLDPGFFHKLLGVPDVGLPDHVVAYFGGRFRALTTRKILLRPYVRPLFAELRRSGCKIGLVSNTETIVTSHDLRSLGIHEAFDAVILSSQIGSKKPDQRIFAKALNELRATPNRGVFIGDDYAADFQGAVRAGLFPILLCSEKPAPVPCIMPTLAALRAAIEDHAAISVRHGANS